MQPMIMIDTEDGFPETAGVLLARWAWRYRSELAPLGVAAGLVAAAWWLHGTRPHWWLPIAVLTGVAGWAVALFGARWRFPTRAERVYAAVTIYAAGVWMSAATAVGPFRPPLPQALAAGGLVVSAPWWAHRRRRAKVRLDRKLQAWPDIAKAIGLAGSEVVRHSGCVGVARTVPAGTRPDRRRRGLQDPPDRIGPGIIPGRHTGLPDAG
jgi:S-DNA-T family DNA segregation ATPase FtsK/SpoIIIE